MKELPDKEQLTTMWVDAVNTTWENFSKPSSWETGTRPHHTFAQMLYNYLTDKQFPGLYEPQREESTTQET